MTRPPFLLPVVAAVGTALLVLALWAAVHRRPALPHRRHIDAGRVTGVERRFRTNDPEAGRRLLRRLGSMPAVLVPRDAAWHVWCGRNLTVVPVDAKAPHATLAEFTGEGRPRIAVQRAAWGNSPDDAGLEELVPPPAQIPLAAVVPHASRIQAFDRLSEAAAAARVGVDADGLVDHIVGGSRLYPVYHVVPLRGRLSPSASVPDPDSSLRVWVRRSPLP